ncbi:rhomboid family intramembrane serine protease [Flavobacterium foetidum]|uniref:rhomboid family intramembrane serine protease n=1 Tax=Flavobacterium foetidum TaxID=2026681 RepID=UPI001074D362|nr:rhomboid family intramembrane serine protease [Flavobacterium foetidum]KAF2517908.1 rhomboid family intramembrane serine protease [Flavobacterium foetidum]
MNKTIHQKINILFIPFLITSIGFCAIYTFLNWILLIKLQLFSIKEFVIEFGLPAFLPVIPIVFFFRPRLKILNLKKSNGKSYSDLFIIILWLAIAVPTIIAQNYLKNSTGKLSKVDYISQISKQEPSKYYKVKRFYLDKSKVGVNTSFEVGGKYNENFSINLFIVVPILDKKSDTATISSCKYWLGIKYDERMSNRLDEREKQNRYEEFLKLSQYEFDRTDFSDFVYLEKVGNSEIGDGYKEALKKFKKFNTEGSIIFISNNKPFESRRGDTLYWLIGTFLSGIIVWLVMILIPVCNRTELRRFEKGTFEDKDLKEFLDFLKPRENFYITPILMYSNILIYLIMVVAGLGFISFKGYDLLDWGGNFRPATINGQWWRLLTNIFLHGGFIHLLSNMFGLLFVGIFIEPVLGRLRYILLYLITGILASCSSIWWYEATVSIGASGAIFGLYGVFLGLLLKKVFPEDLSKAFLTTTLIFVGYNLIMGLIGGIDNAAHIGGLLSGFIFGIIISKSVKNESVK